MRRAATTLILCLTALVLSGCAQLKPWAKTAIEAARHACAAYATQAGLSFKDVCETEKQLRPFIDAILAAQAAHGAARCPTCPECPPVGAKPPPAQPMGAKPPPAPPGGAKPPPAEPTTPAPDTSL